mmetsp:Transcript_16323/g.28179  ORF Transcript_16323/g.28179 Transcript_16323/m.28179 type:complete len:571 (-) Transcript_16323:2328-4040(-)
MASSMAGVRGLVELVTIGTGCFWLGAVQWGSASRPCESAAIVAELGLLAVSMLVGSIPRKYLQNSRTCPDNGVCYIVLPSCVFLSLLARGSQARYYSFLFWACVISTIRYVVETMRICTKFSFMDIVFSVLGCFLWTISNPEVENDITGMLLLGFHLLMSMLIRDWLIGIWIQAFQKSFTIGEGFILVQCISLVVSDVLMYSFGQFFVVIGEEMAHMSDTPRTPVAVAIEGGICGVLAIPVVLAWFFRAHAVLENETVNVNPRIRIRRVSSNSYSFFKWKSPTLKRVDILVFYGSIAVWLGMVVTPWVSLLLQKSENSDSIVNPILFVRDYTFSNSLHIGMLLFWGVALLVGLPIIHYIAANTTWPLIITRKLYHLLALILFGPAFILTPDFLGLSFAIACALLLVVEYIRICRVPPFGDWIHFYLRSYTDSRDEGTTILTHIYLLLGCAVPLWLFRNSKTCAYLGGLVILGAGDAAGAIVGSTTGKIRWPGGMKTVEGTIAAVGASLACFAIICQFTSSMGALDWQVLVITTLLTCILEAFTKQIDNLTLPVFYASLLSLSANRNVKFF